MKSWKSNPYIVTSEYVFFHTDILFYFVLVIKMEDIYVFSVIGK